MATREYEIDVNGAKSTYLFDEADAERLGLKGGKHVDDDEVEADRELAEPVPVKAAAAPKNKARGADGK